MWKQHFVQLVEAELVVSVGGNMTQQNTFYCQINAVQLKV